MKPRKKPVIELIKDSMKKDITKPLNFKNISIKSLIIGDWKNFFIFILIMFLAYGYANDTAACRELIEDTARVCMEFMTDNPQFELNTGDINLDGATDSTREVNQSEFTFNLSGYS